MFSKKTKTINDLNKLIEDLAKISVVERNQAIDMINRFFTVNKFSDETVTSIVLTVLNFVASRNPLFVYNSLAGFAGQIAKKMGYDLVINPEEIVAKKIAQDNKKRKVDNYIG